MHSRLDGKPGVSKGGQHTILCCAQKRFSLFYIARSSMIKRPQGFGQEGPSEVKRLIDLVETEYKTEANPNGRVIHVLS